MGLFETPYRPKVAMPLKPLEIGVELFTLACIIANLALFAHYWPLLPGAPTEGINRLSLFLFVTLLPMVVYLGATVMGLFPRGFSYPVPITAENAAREYRLGTNMLRSVKAEVALCMLDVEWVFINIGMGEDMSLSTEFVIVFLGILVITILFFLYEMNRQK